jgi:hypothetical protein
MGELKFNLRYLSQVTETQLVVMAKAILFFFGGYTVAEVVSPQNELMPRGWGYPQVLRILPFSSMCYTKVFVVSMSSL